MMNKNSWLMAAVAACCCCSLPLLSDAFVVPLTTPLLRTTMAPLTAFDRRCHHLFGTAPNNEHNKMNDRDSIKEKHNQNLISNIKPLQMGLASLLFAVALTSTTVLSPTIMIPSSNNDNHVLPSIQLTSSSVAMAKEMASGTGSRVNKDPESLLRWGLPITNQEVRTLQDNIEQAKYDIGSKRKSAALDKLSKAKAVITNAKSVNSMLTACGPSHQATCQSVVDAMKTTQLPKLQQALQDSLTYSNGSDQERAALDQAYLLQTQLAKSVSALEENMVPTNYHTPVPDKFADLPQLQGGRATVEMVLQKPKSTTRPFTVNSQVSNTAKLVMVIDGYTAPVTSGNFVDLVQKGFYNNMPIQRSDGFVVQTGDPEGDAVGYTGGTPSKALGAGPHGERLIPNEVMVRGDTAPFYETTLEDEGRGGQAVVLPFSAYGAMGWARDEYEANSGSSQFFWLLFESDLTPAGKNVLDGRYPCFGYVVEGSDYLSDVEEGDMIVSAKVTKGLEHLVQPKAVA